MKPQTHKQRRTQRNSLGTISINTIGDLNHFYSREPSPLNMMQLQITKKNKGVPQSQTAAPPRHQEKEETDKSKQAQIDQTYEEH